jgi:transposase
VDKTGRIVRVFVTKGTTADCKLGLDLIKGLDILKLLADRGYDVNAIIEYAKEAGMEICIPSKQNRKEQREHDKELYKYRHIVENVFQKLKEWRGIATRYAKNICSFLATIQIWFTLDYLKKSE